MADDGSSVKITDNLLCTSTIYPTSRLVAGPVQSKVKTLVLVSDLLLHQPATAYFMPPKIDVTFI